MRMRVVTLAMRFAHAHQHPRSRGGFSLFSAMSPSSSAVKRSIGSVKIEAAALVCAALSALLYLNTLSCGFAFDDKAVIIDNGDIRPNASWLNLFRNDFWGTPISNPTSHKSYRPLTVATFRLNYMLHELQPLGYHLVNVLLHSAVCYLYVLLCGVVFSEVWPALIAGLLFAVHPIHTEAVSRTMLK